MKIVIFTRTGFHHTSFINRLLEEYDIACVVRESYPARDLDNSFSKNGPDNYLSRFHEQFSAGFIYHPVLKKYLSSPFDKMIEKSGTDYREISLGAINSVELELYLKDLKPDIIAVLGSSVISPRIITGATTAIINLHSGLSPYYRGTWGYGWPLVNEEPEYIGATVHHIDPGIDTGDIIYQTRPVLENHDDLNAIFLKVISEGIELVVRAIGELASKGKISSFEQPQNTGKQYYAGDLTEEAARRCLQNLENGIISQYNAEKERRDAYVKLYGYIAPVIFK